MVRLPIRCLILFVIIYNKEQPMIVQYIDKITNKYCLFFKNNSNINKQNIKKEKNNWKNIKTYKMGSSILVFLNNKLNLDVLLL